MTEPRDDGAQREIGGPEVVSPLADAVRLVDDEEWNAKPFEERQEGLIFELFGSRVYDPDLPRANAFPSLQLLLLRKRGVERDDVGNVPLAQHVELILHQRNQRADDDRRSFEQEC